MQLRSVTLPRNHDIILFSDTHCGTKACSLNTVAEIVNVIVKGKNTFAQHLGDAVEAKLVDGKHFMHEVHDARETPMVQATKFCDLVRAIPRHRWIGLHKGNHEFALHRFGDITGLICDNLGIPYLGFSARITVRDKDGNVMYRMLSTHGRKLLRSVSPDPIIRRKNMESQLKRSLAVLGHGDCVVNVCGHGHQLMVVEPMHEPYFTDDGEDFVSHYTKADHREGWIDEDLRYYAMCGTQARTIIPNATTYSELNGYGAVQLGYVRLVVRDGKIQGMFPVTLDGGRGRMQEEKS